MRIKTTLAVAASLLTLGTVAGPAAAEPPLPIVESLPSAIGYCNLATLTGDVDYTPAIQFGPTAQPVSWLMSVKFTCTGTGVYNGAYEVTIGGTGSESCLGGTGESYFVWGAKTSGPGAGPIVDGHMRFKRAGLHYYISHPANGLTFTVQETDTGALRPYQANLWLDLPTYLRPYVTADIEVSQVIGAEGMVGIPSARAAVSFEPAACVDAHALVGHGFLGERYRVVAELDDAVAAELDNAVARVLPQS